MTEKRVVAILKLQKIEKSNVEVEEVVEELKLACKGTGGILPSAGLNLEIRGQAHVDMPPVAPLPSDRHSRQQPGKTGHTRTLCCPSTAGPRSRPRERREGPGNP